VRNLTPDELRRDMLRLQRLISRKDAAFVLKDELIASQGSTITGLNAQVTYLESVIAAGGGGTPDPELLEQIATLTEQVTEFQESSNRPRVTWAESEWTWNETISPTGGSTTDWQAGKFTTVQHDTSGTGPGLSIVTKSGAPAMKCTLSNLQPNISGSHKRAEGVVSAIGSPGDLWAGDIFEQECEMWLDADFPVGASNDWAVMPKQRHQSLSLGNGGPDHAWELHGDRWRQRNSNGVFDKPINSSLWSQLYGLSGDGGVVNTTGLNAQACRGRWTKVKTVGRISTDYTVGWIENYIDDVQLVNPLGGTRFFIATCDFDGNPAAPANGSAVTYTPSKGYLKFGFYQKAGIVSIPNNATRSIYVRGMRALKRRPVFL
jgi:hypothetical protein